MAFSGDQTGPGGTHTRYCSLLSNLAYFYSGVAESTSLIVGDMPAEESVLDRRWKYASNMQYASYTLRPSNL